MEVPDDIEKQIELKKLEIEKLKLERELNSSKATVENANTFKPITEKYPNQIALNICLLVAACLSFYILPWGRFSSNINTAFGNQNYLSSGFTGFNLGLFTYSLPMTVVNIVILIFIINNSLKNVGIIAIIGFIIAGVASFNIFQVQSIHSSFSSSFGSVSSGVEQTGYSYILPISYCLLFILNLTKEKSGSTTFIPINQDSETRKVEAQKLRIEENKLRIEENKLRRRLENEKHFIDSAKYSANVLIELVGLFLFVITTCFLLKNAHDISGQTTRVLLLFLVLLMVLFINNIAVQVSLPDVYIKTSFGIVIFKLIYYSVLLSAICSYLFIQIMLNYNVIPVTESYLEAGGVVFLTMILIVTINEKKAIRLNVNPNTESL